jgi:hypothetical protein
LLVIHTVVFWVVTTCSHMGGGYHRFGGTCCLHMQKTEIAGSSATQRHFPEDRNLRFYRRENLKPHTDNIAVMPLSSPPAQDPRDRRDVKPTS